MPLVTIHLRAGRSDEALRRLLDTLHTAVVDAFGVPVRDRYQLVSEHAEGRMIVEDTGLGLVRSPDVVVVEITSRPRDRADKEKFYRLLTERWQAECGLAPADVVVSITENTDADWSFGEGRAQFLTGEL